MSPQPVRLTLILATVLYSYESTCAGELSLEVGELITNITKNTGSAEWWQGKGKNGEGQFPATYVNMFEAVTSNVKVRALYDFSPVAPGELGFKEGDILIVTQSSDANWWEGKLNGLHGAFPAAYVEKL